MIEPQVRLDLGQIYLDYHATTPVDPRVATRMDEVLRTYFGNPSSSHGVGKDAHAVAEGGRQDVADIIHALPGEVVFTSGATESNNIAIQGAAIAIVDSPSSGRKHIISSSIEHKSVLKAADRAAKITGGEHHRLPVDSHGLIDLNILKELLDEETLLVSIQAANNEIGTIQPLREIGNLCRSAGALYHCDAAQALGRIEISVDEWGVDLLSLSGHKAYGPKGIGALYMRKGPVGVPVEALMLGGGQEKGMRPGTLNVPAIAGFGEACRIISEEMHKESAKLQQQRDALEQKILEQVDFSEVVGSTDERLPSTTNLRFRGVQSEAILARMSDVALSSGSACESGAPEPSHVLQAIGLDREAADECIRVAVGRFTQESDVTRAAMHIVSAAHQVAAVAPPPT